MGMGNAPQGMQSGGMGMQGGKGTPVVHRAPPPQAGKGGGPIQAPPQQGMNPGKGQAPQGMNPGKGGEQVRGGPVMRTPPQSGKGGQPMPGPYQGQGFTPFGQMMSPMQRQPMGIHQQLMGNFRLNPQATQNMLTYGPRLVNPIGGQAPGSGPGTMAPGGQQPSPGGAPGGPPGPNIGLPPGREPDFIHRPETYPVFGDN